MPLSQQRVPPPVCPLLCLPFRELPKKCQNPSTGGVAVKHKNSPVARDSRPVTRDQCPATLRSRRPARAGSRDSGEARGHIYLPQEGAPQKNAGQAGGSRRGGPGGGALGGSSGVACYGFAPLRLAFLPPASAAIRSHPLRSGPIRLHATRSGFRASGRLQGFSMPSMTR